MTDKLIEWNPDILWGTPVFCRHQGACASLDGLSGSWRPAGRIPRSLPHSIAEPGNCGASAYDSAAVGGGE